MTIEFTLANQTIIGLNGGPEFSFTPASSFLLNVKHYHKQKRCGKI